jgi:hypothetical protein
MPRSSLVLVTPGEARALKLRRRVPGLGERRVHGQTHGFVRVSAAQLRSLCEHSGRRKGVKVKVGGKSVRAFPNPRDSLKYTGEPRSKLADARNSLDLAMRKRSEKILKELDGKALLLETQIEASRRMKENNYKRMALPRKPQFDEVE